MTDREQNLIQRIRDKLPRFKDDGIVTERDDFYEWEPGIPVEEFYQRRHNPNPWTEMLADCFHDIADDVEEIAENPDADGTEERLHEIAADVREVAEHYEEHNG